MSKLDQRGYIKTCSALNQTSKDIHANLVDVYGDRAYSYRSVALWVSIFNSGREDIEDLSRSGRPITETNQGNIDLVEKLIDKDPHVSYSDLEVLTSLSRGTLERIVKEKLDLVKKASRWIPHLLTSNNKQRRFEFSKAVLAKLQSCEWRLEQILTVDECLLP